LQETLSAALAQHLSRHLDPAQRARLEAKQPHLRNGLGGSIKRVSGRGFETINLQPSDGHFAGDDLVLTPSGGQASAQAHQRVQEGFPIIL